MRLGFVKTLIFALSLTGANFALGPAAHATNAALAPKRATTPVEVAYSGKCESLKGKTFIEGKTMVTLDHATYYMVSESTVMRETVVDCPNSSLKNFKVAQGVSLLGQSLVNHDLTMLTRSAGALAFSGVFDDRDLGTVREAALLNAKVRLSHLLASGKNADSHLITNALRELDPSNPILNDRAVPETYAITDGGKNRYEPQQGSEQLNSLGTPLTGGAIQNRAPAPGQTF